jgi:SAM-dependent methyltransferase
MGSTDACLCCLTDLPEQASLHGVDRMYGIAGESEIRVCPNCGTGRAFPVVDEADLGSLYPESYAPHVEVEESSGRPRALLRRVAKALQRRSELRRPPIGLRPARAARLLDVGCGRGDLGALMIELGWTVTGIEPSAAACEVAEGRGMEMYCGTLASVDLADRSFEIVSFRHSFEHVYDPNVDLQRVLPHLAPGGQLMLSVPNFGSWQRKLFGSAWFHLDLPRHRFHYTGAGLTRLLERHGLEVVAVDTTCSPFGIVGSVTNAVAGRWIWDTPLKSNIAYVVSLVIRPLDLLVSHFGGGDSLHVVARRAA